MHALAVGGLSGIRDVALDCESDERRDAPKCDNTFGATAGNDQRPEWLKRFQQTDQRQLCKYQNHDEKDLAGQVKLGTGISCISTMTPRRKSHLFITLETGWGEVGHMSPKTMLHRELHTNALQDCEKLNTDQHDDCQASKGSDDLTNASTMNRSSSLTSRIRRNLEVMRAMTKTLIMNMVMKVVTVT